MCRHLPFIDPLRALGFLVALWVAETMGTPSPLLFPLASPLRVLEAGGRQLIGFVVEIVVSIMELCAIEV